MNFEFFLLLKTLKLKNRNLILMIKLQISHHPRKIDE